MSFYDLSKNERVEKLANIQYDLLQDIKKGSSNSLLDYFSDEDTYIRKGAYQGLGKIYNTEISSRPDILKVLRKLLTHKDELVRQSTVNAAGEIGMFQFEEVADIFNKALFDEHHKVRNAVIGSMKKMGQKNPTPILNWAETYLKHPDEEVRREICHGLELRGRTHPEDILPLLKELQYDKEKRVRDTLVHVLGQIAYKKGCLPKVISALNTWDNKKLVRDAVDEIVDVHSLERYASFSDLDQKTVIEYISSELKEK